MQQEVQAKLQLLWMGAKVYSLGGHQVSQDKKMLNIS